MPKLLDGEEEIVTLRKHWIVPVKQISAPVVAGFALLVIADGFAATVVPGDLRFFLTLLTLSIVGLWALIAYIQWKAAQLTITDHRVIVELGVFNRSSKAIPLDRVQDVSTKQTLLGRMLDYGDVEIDAAGASGREQFDHVGEPERLQNQVFSLSEHLRRG
jgi:uncharacterized membrane protein YdbT with pleckstrin-like domain